MTLPSFDVDQLLADAVRTVGGAAVWTPACNAYEDEQGFWVEAAVPGMNRQDMAITLEDSVLTIRGQRKADNQENRRYFTHELGAGMFERSFRLPAHVDPNKIVASYKEGVLTIELPKREEAKPRQIAIS